MDKNILKNVNIKLAIVLTLLLLIITQGITIYVDNLLKDTNSMNLIENKVNLTYIKNSGGAFGIGRDDTLSFILVSIIVIGIIIYFLVNQRENMDKVAVLSLSLIMTGGISNLIDRVFRGAVIDYIDISQILKFPVFNLADVFIVTGWIIFIVTVFVFWNKTSKEKEKIIRNKNF